jgi:hypothetical protein
LETAQKALSKEKSSRSAVAKALVDERVVQKVVEQALKKSIQELSKTWRPPILCSVPLATS